MNLRALTSAFIKEGGIGLAVIVLLMLMVFIGGDYFELEPRLSQALMAGIVFAGLAIYAARRIMARRQARKLTSKFMELAAEDADATLGERKAKQQEIASLLREGVAALRLSEQGEQAITQLPWYLVIGPANAGKSMLLETSGQNFATLGRVRKPVSEAGTTRDLDWWVSSQGVFLDVPGRYISDAGSPFEWPAFVSALRQTRAQAPVSGVLVVIPLPEILALKNDELEPWAKNIRDRLDELSSQCRWVFPVYVVFSKCDCVKGFDAAFSNLAEEGRRQAFGATLPFAVDENRNYRTIFHDECNRLSEPLRLQVLASLAQDLPGAAKEGMALFPRQFFLAQRRMGEVLGPVFRPNPFIETGLLRGFYFTSATQGGPLHDLVSERVEQLPAPAEKAAFFVSQIFADVLPPDRYLARLSFKESRRRRALTTLLAAASLLLALMVSAGMALAFSERRQNIVALAQARALQDPFARMDALREALQQAEANRSPVTRLFVFNGDPEGRAVGETRQEYHQALRARVIQPAADFLAEEIHRLRDQRVRSIADYDRMLAAFVALRALAGRGDLKAEALRPELERALAALAPEAAMREVLFRQSDYLLARPAELASCLARVDSGLLEVVDRELRGALWIEAAFADVMREAPADLPALNLQDLVASPGRSCLALGQAVPGIYTQRGYDTYVAPAMASRAQEIARRYAALGENKPAWSIEASLTDYYADAYARAWDDAQASFTVADFASLSDCAQGLKSLTGPDSAMRELMVSLRAGRTLLLKNGTRRNVSGDDLKWLETALNHLRAIHAALEPMLQSTNAGSHLMEYLAQGKLDALLGTFNDVARGLDDVAAVAPRESKDRMGAVLSTLLEGVIRELREAALAEAGDVWRTSVAASWRLDLAPYYPFNAESVSEAAVGAVSRLLNPVNGTLWVAVAVFEKLRAKSVNGRSLLEYGPEFSAALERAARLRDSLFDGGETARVPFSVVFDRGEGVADVGFTLGDKSVTYTDLGTKAAEFAWTESMAPGVRVQARVGQSLWLNRSYPAQKWGIVRLFSEAKRTPVGERRVKCAWVFTQMLGTRTLSFMAYAEFEFGSGVAFEPALFSELKLPETLR